MTESESKALQAREKTEVTTPAADIFETEKEITLPADMPGVKADALNIDLHENVLTLSGEVQSPEGPNEIDIIREYRTGRYYKQFTLSQLIDQARSMRRHLVKLP